MSSKEKFEELMKSIEQGGVGLKPTISKEELYPDPFIGELKKMVSGMGKISLAQKAAGDPEGMYKATKADNDANLAHMPFVADQTQWLVQVYPDHSNVLHFQAKSVKNTPKYTKWYWPASPSTWKQIADLYQNSSGRRKSFFEDSGKEYMICKAKGDDLVEVPGHGTFNLPELFHGSGKPSPVDVTLYEKEEEGDNGSASDGEPDDGDDDNSPF